MKQQLNINGTWRNVYVTAIGGCMGGLALSPLLTYVVTLMNAAIEPLTLVALSAGSSLLFLPSLVCASLVPRPGAAFMAALCSGTVLALTTAFPTYSLVAMLICGLLAEGAIAGATRYRLFTLSTALATGGLLGGLVFLFNLLGHNLDLPLTPAVSVALFAATLGTFAGMVWVSFVSTQRWRRGAHSG